MAIRQGKQFKVIEQSHQGDGCGTIMASFSEDTHSDAIHLANDRAVRLAHENPGTRYYVFGTCTGIYEDRTGGIVRRTY